MDREASQTAYCGYVTILGRPNVGKSTLLNNLLGQKISITSPKRQTTTRYIIGILTTAGRQAIFIDTPGIQVHPQSRMNRRMCKEALNAITGVDVLLYLVEAMKWTKSDEHILNLVKNTNILTLLVVNKIDKVKPKELMLPFLQQMSEKMNFNRIIPISALSTTSIKPLREDVFRLLPSRCFQYPEDQITDKNQRYLAAEFIREKLIRKLRDELPYSTLVTIDSFIQNPKLVNIHATIWVATQRQKPIIIGRNGLGIKAIGEKARKDMERMLEAKVLLKIWVKVKYKRMNERILAQSGLGY